MNAGKHPPAFDLDAALDWVRGSLAQGSSLALLLTPSLPCFSAAQLLVPDEQASGRTPSLDDHGRGYRIGRRPGSCSLSRKRGRDRPADALVEGDLARRGDPGLEGNIVFVEDRILRWKELGRDVGPAVSLLRTGSSGYPLNAFVCSGMAAGMGLIAGSQLDATIQGSIVESTVAIIVSAYDREAYVILLAPRLAERLAETSA